jgi:hypothetical protein
MVSSFFLDVPEAPTNFTITLCDSDDNSIELNWIDTLNSSGEVEDYVLEQSINGEEFQLVRKLITHIILRNVTPNANSIVIYTYVHRISCALVQDYINNMPTY